MIRQRKPRQGDDVALTFRGRVVYVHPGGQHIVLADKDGVETEFTWRGAMAPEVRFDPKLPDT